MFGIALQAGQRGGVENDFDASLIQSVDEKGNTTFPSDIRFQAGLKLGPWVELMIGGKLTKEGFGFTKKIACGQVFYQAHTRRDVRLGKDCVSMLRGGEK